MNSAHKNGGLEPSAQDQSSTSYQPSSSVSSKAAATARKGLAKEVMDLSVVYHRPAFRSLSVYRSVSNTALGLVAGIGTGTLTSVLSLDGREGDTGYATPYHAYSRGIWDHHAVHQGTLKAALPLCDPSDPIVAALDATMVEKTSKNLYGTRWCHDAAGPKGIGIQLAWGLPLSHIALIIPTRENFRATPVTVGLDLIPGKAKSKQRKKAKDDPARPRKPGRPTREESAQKAQELKLPKATEVGLTQIQRLRSDLDALGAKDRHLIVATDGAYINKTLLPNLPDRVSLVGRARRDAVLYGPSIEPGSRHGDRLPTPEQIALDSSFPTSYGKFFYGGDKRELRYKVLPHPVLWRFDKYHVGVLRLIVLMPIRYLGPSGKYHYNAYYYALTNDLTTPVETLAQAVLDRWQIEVLHRDLKHDIGLGTDQCRNPVSMARVPSMVAATYALVKVAALRLYGPNRNDKVFQALPRWRQDLERHRARRRLAKNKVAPVLRYSVQDLLTLLRKELLFRWIQGKARRG